MHNVGEIWALTLWEVRSRVIADPAGANGDVPTGNHTMLQLVTDALKMTPIDPTLHRRARRDHRRRLRHERLRQRGLDLGRLRRPRPGLRRDGALQRIFGVIVRDTGDPGIIRVPYLDVVDPATDVTVDDSAAQQQRRDRSGRGDPADGQADQPVARRGKAVTGATATLTTSTPGREDHRRHVDLRRDRAAGHGRRRHLPDHRRARVALRQRRSTSRSPRPPTSAPPRHVPAPRRRRAAAPTRRSPIPAHRPDLAIPDDQPARRLRTS